MPSCRIARPVGWPKGPAPWERGRPARFFFFKRVAGGTSAFPGGAVSVSSRGWRVFLEAVLPDSHEMPVYHSAGLVTVFSKKRKLGGLLAGGLSLRRWWWAKAACVQVPVALA